MDQQVNNTTIKQRPLVSTSVRQFQTKLTDLVRSSFKGYSINMFKVIPKLQSKGMTRNWTDTQTTELKALVQVTQTKYLQKVTRVHSIVWTRGRVFTEDFTEFKASFTSKISFNACDIQNCLLPNKSGYMQEYGEPMACSELLHVQWNMLQDSDVTRLFHVILYSLFHSQNIPLIYVKTSGVMLKWVTFSWYCRREESRDWMRAVAWPTNMA